MMRLVLLSIGALAVTCPAAAQTTPPDTASAATTDPDQPEAIIIERYRDRRKQPTIVDAPPAVSGVQNRQRYEISERVAKCAARGKVVPLSRLRAVVDGEFNSPTQALAQDRLRRLYVTCGEGVDILGLTVPDAPSMSLSAAQDRSGPGLAAIEQEVTGAPVNSDPAPLGHSIYDRGAFTMQAIKTFAPALTLTRQETNDPEVQRRFNMREVPRNRLRLPLDMEYFRVAVCMVKLEPNLSVRMAMSDGPAEISGLQAAIINRARPCVGGAKSVRVDATQFRLYIADAVYRWAVAARGVDTLIPLH